MADTPASVVSLIRVGQAAEMLGVTVETMRRWETEGRLHMERSAAASAWSHLPTSPASWPNAARPEPSARSSAGRRAIAFPGS